MTAQLRMLLVFKETSTSLPERLCSTTSKNKFQALCSSSSSGEIKVQTWQRKITTNAKGHVKNHLTVLLWCKNPCKSGLHAWCAKEHSTSTAFSALRSPSSAEREQIVLIIRRHSFHHAKSHTPLSQKTLRGRSLLTHDAQAKEQNKPDTSDFKSLVADDAIPHFCAVCSSAFATLTGELFRWDCPDIQPYLGYCLTSAHCPDREIYSFHFVVYSATFNS